ncbi:MAG: acetaldehyde dehydrogenase, partial [Clostridia bacterium]
LKKPVGRLLVNTPATFGAMGMTTNLTPSVTLGSGSAGFGITADNVSPRHFIYTRKVGYGVRPAPKTDGESDAAKEQPLDASAIRRLFGNLAHILENVPSPGDSS